MIISFQLEWIDQLEWIEFYMFPKKGNNFDIKKNMSLDKLSFTNLMSDQQCSSEHGHD